MLNKVTVIGRLGRDPELRTFQDGGKVTNVTVATTEKWKDKNSGEMKEHTEWHKVSFSGRLAEIASDYLQKGSLVYVEGSLRTRKWTDQSGVEKYMTEIRGDQLKMLSRKNENEDSASHQAKPNQQDGYRSSGGRPMPSSNPAQPEMANSGFNDMNDDIPF